MAALGIVLLIIGAILSFAITDRIEGADLTTIGYILMGGGGVALLVGLFQRFSGARTTTTRQVSDDGRTVVEDQRFD